MQGFGNVGTHLARMLHEEGASVVAVSDSRGGLYNPEGLDLRSVIAHKAEHGVLEGFAGAEPISNEELVLLDCDVLAPCALEQVITTENAPQVKARIICEGANGPITPSADDILEDRGVLVLPDVLANAGGVVVSYFEWVQGLQEYFWKEDEVNARLNDIVTRAFRETVDTRAKHAYEHADGGLRAGRAARRGGDRRRAASTHSGCRCRGSSSTTRTAVICASARSRWSSRSARVTTSAWTSAATRDSRREYRSLIPVVEVDGERAFTFFVQPEALRRRLATV